MYDFDADLTVMQQLIGQDKKILELMDLTGKPLVDITKRIIKHSQWNDLADNTKRLCIYPLPSRYTRSSILFEEVVEVDIHAPSSQSHHARQIIGRVVDILNNQRINGRYITFKGQLGELPTATGFYCCGVRFSYYSPV